MFKGFTISSWEEIDYGNYHTEECILYTEEDVSEEEWMEIVENAFNEILEEDSYPNVDDVGEYIVENDERFKKAESLFQWVRTSKLEKDYLNGFSIKP